MSQEKIVSEKGQLGEWRLMVSQPVTQAEFFYIIRNHDIVGIIILQPGQSAGSTFINEPVAPGDVLRVASGLDWDYKKPSLMQRILGFFRANSLRTSIVFRNVKGTTQIILAEAKKGGE